MKLLRWLGRQLYFLAMVLWANGVIVRISLRDSLDSLAPLYYLTPWPVLAVLTLPFIYTVRRQPGMVFGVIVVAHLFLGAWIVESWRAGEPSIAPADLRVVQWNVARPEWRFPGVVKTLRSLDADILAVAEPEPKDREHPARWAPEFPGYTMGSASGNIILLVRGEIINRHSGPLGPASYYAIYDLRVKGHDLRVVQVDINGVPTASRRQPLARLSELTATLKDRPLIVLGDFNTPRDSVHLAGLRKHCTNTFEVAGIGSAETWPVPLPVLSLDQIWCSAALTPVRCRHGINFTSDHRSVVAELCFSETRN